MPESPSAHFCPVRPLYKTKRHKKIRYGIQSDGSLKVLCTDVSSGICSALNENRQAPGIVPCPYHGDPGIQVEPMVSYLTAPKKKAPAGIDVRNTEQFFRDQITFLTRGKWKKLLTKRGAQASLDRAIEEAQKAGIDLGLGDVTTLEEVKAVIDKQAEQQREIKVRNQDKIRGLGSQFFLEKIESLETILAPIDGLTACLTKYKTEVPLVLGMSVEETSNNKLDWLIFIKEQLESLHDILIEIEEKDHENVIALWKDKNWGVFETWREEGL